MWISNIRGGGVSGIRIRKLSSESCASSIVGVGGVSGASEKGLDDVSSIQGIIKLFIWRIWCL